MPLEVRSMHFPGGWQRKADPANPGKHFYEGPGGNGQRKVPPAADTLEPFRSQGATDSAIVQHLGETTPRGTVHQQQPASPMATSHDALITRRRRPFTSESSYRAEYRAHRPTDAAQERADRLLMFNPSTAPHPKALGSACILESVSQATYKAHPPQVPEPPARPIEAPPKSAPSDYQSTSRADFVPHQPCPTRPRHDHVAPRKTPFLFTTTQRSAFRGGNDVVAGNDGSATARERLKNKDRAEADASARAQARKSGRGTADLTSFNFSYVETKPVAKVPAPPSAANTINSGRAGACSASVAAAGPGVFGFSAPDLRATVPSQYRDSYRPEAAAGRTPSPRKAPPGHEARQHERRAWRYGLNKSTPDQFVSQYRAAFRDDQRDEPRIGPMVSASRTYDRNVVTRNKLHEELMDY